jgi:hypothetical protein
VAHCAEVCNFGVFCFLLQLGVFPSSLFFKEHGIETSDVKFWHLHLETIVSFVV